MKTPQQRQFEQVKDKFYSLLQEFENTLELMPIKGLKSDVCQRTNIQQSLNHLDSCINSIELEDFTPNEYSNDFKLSYSGKDYVLSENAINGITLNTKIKDEELHEYYIIDRKEFISELIRWTAEASRDLSRANDEQLMKQDLEMLIDWKDDYILTSNSTNSYVKNGDAEFNEICGELLELNKNY